MKKDTITQILEETGFTKKFLKSLETLGVNNGCGGKGGFNFSKFLEKIKRTPSFDFQKFSKLKEDLKIVCGIHDYKFYIGGSWRDYIKANYELANNIQRLTHWRGVIRRTITFLLVFLGTTIFGIKYFNFNNKKTMENTENLEALYEQTYAMDTEQQDPRDIIWEELNTAGDEELLKLPKKVLLDDGSILNQRATKLCVAFGTTNGVNEALNFYGFNPDKDPNVLAGYIRKYLDPDIDKRGTWMINGPKGAEKLGWIEAYTQVNTIKGFKQSIYLGLPIATGTKQLSWARTGKKGVAVKGNGGGHFVSIIGYDDEIKLDDGYGKTYKGAFIVENTWGAKWGINGRYYLPYDLFGVLYNTKKNLIPNKEKARKHLNNLLEEIKKEKEKRKVSPKLVKKYQYYSEDFYLLENENNKNLFEVLQNLLKETGIKPIYRTIIGATPGETTARILDEIYGIRQMQRIKNDLR